MKNVADIARLLADNHIDAIREQIKNGWSRLITDTLEISGPDSNDSRIRGISFISGQAYCSIDLRKDSIEVISILEDDDGRPWLHLETNAGHNIEFDLTQEDEYERAE